MKINQTKFVQIGTRIFSIEWNLRYEHNPDDFKRWAKLQTDDRNVEEFTPEEKEELKKIESKKYELFPEIIKLSMTETEPQNPHEICNTISLSSYDLRELKIFIDSETKEFPRELNARDLFQQILDSFS